MLWSLRCMFIWCACYLARDKGHGCVVLTSTWLNTVQLPKQMPQVDLYTAVHPLSSFPAITIASQAHAISRLVSYSWKCYIHKRIWFIQVHRILHRMWVELHVWLIDLRVSLMCMSRDEIEGCVASFKWRDLEG